MPPKKSYKKSSYKSKLMDNKINTAVEVRVKQIADKAVVDARRSWCSRKYCLGRYDKLTNVFTELNPIVSNVSWSGRIIELSNILQADVDSGPPHNQADDPLTANNENLTGQGLAVGRYLQNFNGTRIKNEIFITGVQADIHTKVPRLNVNDPDDQEGCEIRYGFYLWRDEASVMATPLAKPDPRQLNKWRPFGYNKSIDTADEQTNEHYKTKHLVSGMHRLFYSTTKADQNTVRLSKRFDKPIRITYNPADMTGQLALNWKLYFVVMSDIPSTAGMVTLQPKIYACTKVYYYEA